MSIHVYKYELKVGEQTIICVPNDSEFRHADFQGIRLFVWLEHSDPKDQDLYDVTFDVIGTGPGWDIPDYSYHIKTVQVKDDGQYWVWHIYEIVDPIKENYPKVGEKEMHDALESGKFPEQKRSFTQ